MKHPDDDPSDDSRPSISKWCSYVHLSPSPRLSASSSPLTAPKVGLRVATWNIHSIRKFIAVTIRSHLTTSTPWPSPNSGTRRLQMLLFFAPFLQNKPYAMLESLRRRWNRSL